MESKGKFSYELKVTFIIAILLGFLFFKMVPTTISNYVAEQYLISYKYGFIARGLIGTLLSIKEYWSKYLIYMVGLIVEFLLVVVYLILVYKLISLASAEQKDRVSLVLIIYTMSPMSPAFTFLINNFARFDALLLLIAYLQIILFLKPTPAKGIWICILSVIAILIHPVFVFTYFVIGELLFLYTIKKSERPGQWIGLLVINTALVCGLFLYFEFFRTVGAEWTQDLMFADMQSRTNFDLGTAFYGYLNDWYFGTVDSQMANTVRPFIPIQPIMLFVTIIVMLPYELIYFRTWMRGMKGEKRFFDKLFWLCLILSFVPSLPNFVIQIDWGRWCAAYYASQILVFAVLLADSNPYIIEVCDNTAVWAKQKKVVAVALLLFMCSQGVFQDISQLELGGKGASFVLFVWDCIKSKFGG